MTLAKRHFEELASKLRGVREILANDQGVSCFGHPASSWDVVNMIELRLANFCAAETPAFDRAKFIEAARLKE